MKNIAINTPSELESFINVLNAPIILAQQMHARETLATLERRLADFRQSIEWSMKDGKVVELDCNLRNIITACAESLARAPKPVDGFATYLAIKDLPEA